MIELKELQTGDRIAFIGKSFISRAIIFCMKYYAKKRGLPTEKIPSHWATILLCEDVVIVVGSIENGFRPQTFENAVDLSKDQFEIYRTKNGYTQHQKDEVVRYTTLLEYKSVIYNYLGLLLWVLYIFLGIDWFPRHGGESVEYCYASTKRIMEHVDPSGIPFNANKVDAWDPHRKDDQLIFSNL